MTTSDEISGTCLCGAVKFTASPATHDVGVCHCGMCRRWSAGPFMVIDCGDSVRFDGEENIATFKSSDYGERGFCKTCGTNLFWRMRDGSASMMSANAIDNVSDFKLDHEIFIDDKPDYYDFANKTTKMTGAEVIANFTAKSNNNGAEEG